MTSGTSQRPLAGATLHPETDHSKMTKYAKQLESCESMASSLTKEDGAAETTSTRREVPIHIAERLPTDWIDPYHDGRLYHGHAFAGGPTALDAIPEIPAFAGSQFDSSNVAGLSNVGDPFSSYIETEGPNGNPKYTCTEEECYRKIPTFTSLEKFREHELSHGSMPRPTSPSNEGASSALAPRGPHLPAAEAHPAELSQTRRPSAQTQLPGAIPEYDPHRGTAIPMEVLGDYIGLPIVQSFLHSNFPASRLQLDTLSRVLNDCPSARTNLEIFQAEMEKIKGRPLITESGLLPATHVPDPPWNGLVHSDPPAITPPNVYLDKNTDETRLEHAAPSLPIATSDPNSDQLKLLDLVARYPVRQAIAVENGAQLDLFHCGVMECKRADGFKTEKEVRKHQRVHIPEHELPCACEYDGCSMRFVYPAHLRRHQEQEHSGIQYQCSECEYRASRYDNIFGKGRHFERQHPGARKPTAEEARRGTLLTSAPSGRSPAVSAVIHQGGVWQGHRDKTGMMSAEESVKASEGPAMSLSGSVEHGMSVGDGMNVAVGLRLAMEGPSAATMRPPTTTDEGYYSNNMTEPSFVGNTKDQACDTGSICTDGQDIGEGVSPKARQDLARQFASELVDSLDINDLTNAVLELLPKILQDFSGMLAHKAKFGVERKASIFVRHYRENIAGHARDQLSADAGRDKLEVARYDVSSWAAGVSGPADVAPDTPDDLIDIPDQESGLAEHDLDQARAFLFRSIDFTWLIGRIKTASRTMDTGPQFAAFREDIIRFMLYLPTVITAEVDWYPLNFLDRQYEEDSGVTIGTVITYCGAGDLIEAVGCKDYIHRMWPTYGPMTLSCVEKVVSTRTAREAGIEMHPSMDATSVMVQIQGTKLRVCVKGDPVAIIEILEVLGWLGAACRTSPNPEQAMYCSPSISGGTDCADCSIGFNITALPQQVPAALSQASEQTRGLDTHASIEHTYCWSQLVRNPVIIKGYPVSRRHNDEKGLEIDLGLMSLLAKAARVMIYDGLLMLKSFNSMFVAVAEAGGSVLWHYISSLYGRPVPYSEARKSCQPNVPVPFGALQHARHFVGLTQPLTILTGTANANYDIDPTGDNFVSTGVAIKDFTLGFSRIFVMSAKVVPGHQDTRLPLGKPECFQLQIQSAKSTPVVFYDVEEKRAWMVDGQDALLHLSRAHLSSRFAEPAQEGTSAELIRQFRHRSVVNGRWQRSSEVLCDPHNLRISVGHTYQSTNDSGDQGSSSDVSSPGMCFQDVVNNNLQVLHDIVAYQEDTWQRKKDQIRVGNPFGARKQIVGFGFTDIVSLETRLRPRFAKLKFSGQGWKKYADKAEAIYILGSGFGDLLPNTSDCTKCTGVPPGYEFLVVSARILQHMEDIRGISWSLPDEPALAYENKRSISCQCAASVHGVRCGIVVAELGACSIPGDRSGGKRRNKVPRLQSDGYLIIGRNDDMSNARRAMQLNAYASSACDGCDIRELVRGEGLGGVGLSALSDTGDCEPAHSTSNQDSVFGHILSAYSESYRPG
ncbi:hypothetical protein LTR17_008440 [Elasticomyces elasticus]|nr:hypothetical protein LTR17_008440 [Elasticomyces elasticus]